MSRNDFLGVIGKVAFVAFQAISSPAVAASFHNARDPWLDDVPSGDSSAVLWVAGLFYGGFWLLCLVNQLRQREFAEAWKILLIGLGFTGFCMLIWQAWLE